MIAFCIRIASEISKSIHALRVAYMPPRIMTTWAGAICLLIPSLNPLEVLSGNPSSLGTLQLLHKK